MQFLALQTLQTRKKVRKLLMAQSELLVNKGICMVTMVNSSRQILLIVKSESSIIERLLRYWENYVAGAAGKNLVVGVSTNVNAIIKRVAFVGRNGFRAMLILCLWHGSDLTQQERRYAELLLWLKQGLTPQSRLTLNSANLPSSWNYKCVLSHPAQPHLCLLFLRVLKSRDSSLCYLITLPAVPFNDRGSCPA